MRRVFAVTSCALLLFVSGSVSATEFVINGDFETDHGEFVVWPGYVGMSNEAGDAFNPGEIAEWVGEGGRGINHGNPPSPNSWGVTGGVGVNPIANGDAPFRDNGDNDTHVAFLQGAAELTQSVTGLSIGQEYRLSWDFNARDCCGDFPIGELLLNGDSFAAGDFEEEIFPVGGAEPWYSEEIGFTADSTDLSISFTSIASTGGDATMLLDNIVLFTPDDSTNLLSNGDFETSPEDYNVWPGYSGEGITPFRDNGENYSAAAFLQGTASLQQNITGLTPGEEYKLSLDFNARNCCDDNPVANLLLNGDFVEDFPGEAFDDGMIEPVGAGNPWYRFEHVFVADDSELDLRIETFPFAGGDSTLVIDNVSIMDNTTSVDGDFNGDGQLTAVDIDLLNEEIRAGTNLAEFDVTGDGSVNDADRSFWVETLKNTYFGDSNLDGLFDSADFVAVFTRGEYEDTTPFNSTWEDGDWNGDGDFNSTDFVAAFTGGGYEQGPRAATSAVPEPNGALLALTALLGLVARRRA